MPTFSFKAQKKDGTIYEGTKEAADKFSLYKELRDNGESVISAQIGVKKKGISFDFLDKYLSPISTREKIVFARNLGSMLKAGLPLSRGLTVLQRETQKKPAARLYARVNASVNSGKSFSEALAAEPKTFSRLFVSMVKAGEESGKLAEALKNISFQMHQVHALKKKIMGAMLYPGIILSVVILIGVLMMIFVVPTLTATFAELEVDLPLTTRLVILSSDILQNNLAFVAVVFFVFLGVAIYSFRFRPVRRTFEFVLLKFPIINTLVKQSNSAKMGRTLSSLLDSGVSMLFGLNITSEVIQNTYFKEVLKEAEKKVEKGEALSEVFERNAHLYPFFVAEMASVGEETGKLGEMFREIATYYESEVDQKTKNLSTIVEPILMIFIGIVVGFFAISMLGPMYSLVNLI